MGGVVARGFGWVLMVISALVVFIGALVVVEALGIDAGPDFDPTALAVVVGLIAAGGLLGALGVYLAFARWAR
jgi:hypothetical protein